MKTIKFFISLFVISCTLTIISCADNQKKAKEYLAVDEESPEKIIERGAYLVNAMGCNHCHSPKKMGPNGPEMIPELMLSGFPSDRPIVKFNDTLIKSGFAIFYPDLTATAGPWGVSFAANLTPDDTGIGTWTESQFKKAFTEGKLKGLDNGRMLLPPMPWQDFKHLKDEDIHAIFKYLKSIKPVRNIVPPAVTPDNM
ncbi:Cytochrome c [Zhouia amylolytica]|uniref:Cytochrome c n=1 Tax=Zhouia amylolytica TaxID=376730 RepID=A0A1I6TSC9_9FLAO|nr:c-type cytochrome [Zhouia amylolytica]SFS92173.1 Cytochrome c [Zhouia amylolytica]